MNKRPCRILIIDDDADMRRLISFLLEDAGYAVYQADSGARGLDMARTQHPDIVLLDVLMPGMDGFEVCRCLKKDPMLRHSFVLLMSGGQISSEAQAEILEEAADDYIIRPFDTREFLARIKAIARAKNIEKALRESEERYRHLVEYAPIPILVHCAEQWVFVSPAAITALGGKRAEDLLGRPIWDNLPQETWTEGKKLARILYEKLENNVLMEDCLIRLDGAVIDVELMYTAVNYEGRPAVQMVFKNITERKRAERRLYLAHAALEATVEERTRDLKEANLHLRELAKLKDEFLAGMSHELRSPLNSILGSAEMLEEGIYGPLTPKQAKTLRQIGDSGQHLLSLINDVLDVSKIEAGKLELSLEQVSPHEICYSCLNLFKDAAVKKQLKFHTAFDHSVYALQADARRLKQVLVNLLSNAIKFTPEGGQIGLEFEADEDNHQIRFIVWDNGIGVPEEFMDRLFQPFIQFDSRLSRNYGGTGLGLALVRNLVDLHGGSVSVDSQVNQGSRFTVTLPWYAELENIPHAVSQAEDEVSPMPTLKHPGAHILVVEDNPANRQLVEDYLAGKGYRLSVASDGAQAIRQCRQAPPDVIVMDIQMPGMDGLEVTQHIRGELGLTTLPIIALTALAMRGDRERCLNAGVDAYLSKPVVLRNLLAEIERCLDF